MTPHDWFLEHQGAFVLRTLEPDEEQVFAEHLPGCPECREATGRLSRDLQWMGMGSRPVTPRPGLVQQFTERAVGRRRAPSRWVLAGVLAAAITIVAGSIWWARQTVAAERAARREIASALEEVRDSLAILRSASRVVHATVNDGRDHGGLVLFAEERTHRWTLVLYGLQPPRQGEVIQLWFITDRGMIPGRSISIPTTGPALLTTGMPPGNAQVLGAALTLEPVGPPRSSPAGPSLLRLML